MTLLLLFFYPTWDDPHVQPDTAFWSVANESSLLASDVTHLRILSAPFCIPVPPPSVLQPLVHAYTESQTVMLNVLNEFISLLLGMQNGAHESLLLLIWDFFLLYILCLIRFLWYSWPVISLTFFLLPFFFHFYIWQKGRKWGQNEVIFLSKVGELICRCDHSEGFLV